MSFARKFTYAFFIIIAAGGVAEIGTRVYDLEEYGTPFLASPRIEDLVTRDSLGAHGAPNASYKDIKLNSAGFRSAEDVLTPKPGCVRVMTLGASETLGTGSGASGNEYPAQLADSLKPYGCFQILNAGVQGMGLRSLIRFWDLWASRFHPDVVVLLVTPTMYLLDPLPPYASKSPVPAPPHERFVASRLATHLHDLNLFPDFVLRQRVQNQLDDLTAGEPESWFFHSIPPGRLEIFRSDMDSLITEIEATGASPVVGAYPMRFGTSYRPSQSILVNQWRVYAPRALPNVLIDFGWQARDAVIGLGAERRVPTVDLPKVLNGHDEYFDDWAHYTALGARIVAGQMKQAVLAAAAARPSAD
jgi:hypothetical protein